LFHGVMDLERKSKMAERPTEMDEFLQEPHMARIATTNADGSPHVVPLLYLFNPEDASFFISTSTESVSVRNLRRNPALAICIDDEQAPFRAVVVEGEAQVSGVMGTDHEGLKSVVDHFFGPEMWTNYVDTPIAQKIRVRVTMVPRKWKWWDYRRMLMGSVTLD